MAQVTLTVNMGKRLIAKGITEREDIKKALKDNTIVIIAGTTNGYVAEELLKKIGETRFDRNTFFRGVTIPHGTNINELIGKPFNIASVKDVVIEKGKWIKDKTIYDVIETLKEGDIVLKGANAVDLANKKAAVLIEHPKSGTSGVIVPAVIGRRIKLIIPVGVEKRIIGDIDKIALKVNQHETESSRLFPLPGEVFTELDALKVLADVDAEIMAAGGVFGAEGAVRLLLTGEKKKIEKAISLIESLK